MGRLSVVSLQKKLALLESPVAKLEIARVSSWIIIVAVLASCGKISQESATAQSAPGNHWDQFPRARPVDPDLQQRILEQ
jgi:hypothetical protein